jgi:hypothetical protein
VYSGLTQRCDWLEQLVLCVAICAELRLGLEGRLKLVLGAGGGEGGQLDAEVAEHVQEVGFASFDALSFHLLESLSLREEKLSWFLRGGLGRRVASGLLAHPDPPKKIGQVWHCGQDYPGDVVESETALIIPKVSHETLIFYVPCNWVKLIFEEQKLRHKDKYCMNILDSSSSFIHKVMRMIKHAK